MYEKCRGILEKLQKEGKIEICKNFTFPEKIKLEKSLSDILEDEVEEKFYLSEKYIKYAQESTANEKQKGNGFKFEPTVIGEAAERERE